MDPGNWTWVLRQSSEHSEALSHLSSSTRSSMNQQIVIGTDPLMRSVYMLPDIMVWRKNDSSSPFKWNHSSRLVLGKKLNWGGRGCPVFCSSQPNLNKYSKTKIVTYQSAQLTSPRLFLVLLCLINPICKSSRRRSSKMSQQKKTPALWSWWPEFDPWNLYITRRTEATPQVVLWPQPAAAT